MGRKDILFNEDLEVLNGDFSIQESDQQHINHIMRANKGHYYQFPLIGLGGVKLINGNFRMDQLKSDIKLQLKSDNYLTLDVTLNEKNEILINAEPLTI